MGIVDSSKSLSVILPLLIESFYASVSVWSRDFILLKPPSVCVMSQWIILLVDIGIITMFKVFGKRMLGGLMILPALTSKPENFLIITRKKTGS